MSLYRKLIYQSSTQLKVVFLGVISMIWRWIEASSNSTISNLDY